MLRDARTAEPAVLMEPSARHDIRPIGRILRVVKDDDAMLASANAPAAGGTAAAA